MNRLELAIKKYYKDPNHCKFCGSLIEVLPNRPPSEARRMKFCNHSCSASYNNIGVKKYNKNSQVCPLCGNKKYPTSKLCYKCKTDKIYSKNMDRPIKYFIIGNNLHPRFKHNYIRIWARKLMKYWGVEKKCAVCGYNKHVEVCHRKSIHEFDLDTKMGIVNSRENLVYLCPNHHWELDNCIIDSTV